MWALGGLLEMAALLGGPQLVWSTLDRAGRGPHLAVALASGVVAICYVIGMPLWRYRVHRWEATERAVYTQRGWLNQERRIAPASRVQTVDLRREPLAQLFGLASVRVTTASAAGPLTIEGLTLADATQLVDRLAAAAEAAGDDAT
jgi:membrane protein YdbS with pleckstrin-like domain